MFKPEIHTRTRLENANNRLLLSSTDWHVIVQGESQDRRTYVGVDDALAFAEAEMQRSCPGCGQLHASRVLTIVARGFLWHIKCWKDVP